MVPQFELQVALETLESCDDVARLMQVRLSLGSCGRPEQLRRIAKLLPVTLQPLPPELSLELSRLAMELAPYGIPIAEDVIELMPRLRASWLRAYLCAGYNPAELSDMVLLQIMAGVEISVISRPELLLARVARAHQPRLRQLSLLHLPKAVQNLQISSGFAFSLVIKHCQDEQAAIRTAALKMLTAPFLSRLRPSEVRDREHLLGHALQDPVMTVARAAVRAAAGLACHEQIRAAVFDARLSVPIQMEAMALFGRLAETQDLAPVLAHARREALSFGAVARRFLLQAHRRGVFLREEHLDSLIELFDRHAGWTGEELVRVSYVERGPLLSSLEELDANDARWKRRAAILGASYGVGAERVLSGLLARCTDPFIAICLVRAAGANAEFQDEESLLSWLDRLPEEVIQVLRAKGAAKGDAALLKLINEPLTSSTWRRRALEVVWSHSEHREQLLRVLVGTLGPYESGLVGLAWSSSRDPMVAFLVRDAPWSKEKANQIDLETEFRLLCDSGELRLKKEVIRLFRQQYEVCIAKALQGDFAIKRILLPELEQGLFRYGRFLVEDGRCVRSWIEEAPETGRDFVLSVALEWLAESPSNPVKVALLESIERHNPSGPVLHAIESYWRHSSKQVQRAAIQAILSSGEEARGLELSICKLVNASDHRILCQALEGVASFGARWAEPIVVSCLSHQNMSVKKAAAEALAKIGSPQSIPAIVDWLGRHENRGFRVSLEKALQQSAGGSANAVLVEALTGQSTALGTELLGQALNQKLPMSLVLTLARSKAPAHRALVDVCLSGKVALRDGDADTLALRLHRAELLPPAPEPADPGRELRIHGFSEAAALRLLELRSAKTESRVLAVVQEGFADWLSWVSKDTLNPIEVNLVLAAASHRVAVHTDALLEYAERLGNNVDAAALLSFLISCRSYSKLSDAQRLNAIDLLRKLPPSSDVSGLALYRLLGTLGAVRSDDDLRGALQRCRKRPAYATESATLLNEALQIPAKRNDESHELTLLRLEAAQWFQAAPNQRELWLTRMLEERPLDLTMPSSFVGTPKEHTLPSTAADRERLLKRLLAPEQQERERAAKLLMQWSNSHAEAEVLRAFLNGQISLSESSQQRVASSLVSWPQEQRHRLRARALLPYLGAQQIRGFLPGWIEDWTAGRDVGDVFEAYPVQVELMALVEKGYKDADYRLLALLTPSRSLSQRHLIAELEDSRPSDVAHLVSHLDAKEVQVETLDDPLVGKSKEDLVSLLSDETVSHGLAVRAVHALATNGSWSQTALAALVSDARPKVRSAALRALRQVSSREESNHAALRALKMETRRDVALGLMRGLAHAQFLPALPLLLERVTDSDYRVRQAAHEAVRAWGPSAVSAIERACRKARPDRRPAYRALIVELEQ